MKKIAVINDLSGCGRCSLAVMLPVISAMGCQACPAPTAVLSNHTMYENTFRTDLTESLAPYFEMWEMNGFRFDAVMSGYLGEAEQALAVHAFFEHARAQADGRAPAKIVVDPVMADHGKLYGGMTEAHIGHMRRLCMQADLITPNLTEACFLTGLDYPALNAACKAAEQEHTEAALLDALAPLAAALSDICPGNLAVTGIECGGALWTLTAARAGDTETARKDAIPKKTADGLYMRLIRTERAGQNRPGTGDMFAAMLTAGWLQHGSIYEAAVHACAFIAEAIRHSDALGVPVREGVQFEDLLGKLIPAAETSL